MIRIEKNQPDFKAFKFVLRAKSNNRFKPVYTCLFSDGKNVVCTDSFRLHSIKLVRDVPEGLYDVVVSTAKEIVLEKSIVNGQFPDYKKVLYKEKSNSRPLRVWDTRSNGARTLFDIMSQGVCINPEYIKHACENSRELKIIISESATEPIQITNDFGIAVVMPMRIALDSAEAKE